MPLSDALLPDPNRVNVWIAFRTDGVHGRGTQNDPFDGSTASKFDAIMNPLPEGPTVHLGPTINPFLTTGFRGNSDGSTGSGWQPKAGMRIIGSGIDVTTLRLAVRRSAELHSAVWQICNLRHLGTGQHVGALQHAAESNSAIRQIENLRYFGGGCITG